MAGVIETSAMRIYLVSILIAICTSASASAPPTPVTLTKSLAKELGFQIEIESDGAHLLATVHFPVTISNLWKANSVGFALLDSNGEEIAINAMHYSPESAKPVIVAAFDPMYGSAAIWVSYTCESDVESNCYGKHDVAYHLDSVSEYASSL